MSQVGSFGVNYTKSYGTDPSIVEFAPLNVGANTKGSWIFVKASAAIAQYAWVGVDGEGDAAELTTTTYASSSIIGVAQVALGSGEYGWIWTGNGGGTSSGIKGKVAASYVAFALINTTGTAGVADDAATKILGGVVGLTTDGGSGSSIELHAASFITKVTA
mgnify:CR=1 FL=1